MPILLLTIMLNGMGFGLVLPAFLFYAENLGASPLIATTIVGAYSLGQFVANPVWGRMSDRYGRKPMLIASMTGMVASYTLMAFATSLWVLAVARLMTGLLAGTMPIAMAYVTDVTPLEQRAKRMGWVGGSISLGFIFGPAFGGLLAGADADSATLLWPGIGAAILCTGTLVATFFIKESLPPEKRTKHSDGQPSGLTAIGRVIQRPIVTRLIIIGMLTYFAMGFFETIMPLWSEARFDWGPMNIGYCFMYLGLVVTITQGYLVGRLTPLFGEHNLVLFGVSIYCIGLIWMVLSPNWQLMMIGITCTSGGGSLAVTCLTSLVSHQAGEHERGLVLGVYNSGAWMGRFIGPPMSGFLFQTLSVQAPLIGAAIIMFGCAIAVRSLRAKTRRDAVA